MRSDGGFEPDPNPYRPIPVDFAGPICAQCSHAWTNHTDPGHRDYLCDGFDPTVIAGQFIHVIDPSSGTPEQVAEKQAIHDGPDRGQ
jgi:hypothetical protein